MKIRRSIAAVAVLGGLAITPTVADAGGNGRTNTYRVTIENIADGFQPLSPAGVALHNRRLDIWSTGAPASAAVAAVAEDANGGIFASTYSQVQGVSSAFVGGAAPAGPGGTIEFEFDARSGQRLSIVSMLVNTNDGFTGLDSVPLAYHRVYEVGAYDAGTEVNNELASHIPGPVGGNPFVREPEGNPITRHPGIAGVGDIPDDVAWSGPVARITIQRVD